MPCNLAVSITKAAVLPEHLQKLLTAPVIKVLVESFIKTHEVFKAYPNASVRVVKDNLVELVLDWGHRITIYRNFQGVWQVNGDFQRYERRLGEQITDLLSTLLTKGADRMYARQIKNALQTFGKVEESQAKVKQGTETLDVTLLTFEI